MAKIDSSLHFIVRENFEAALTVSTGTPITRGRIVEHHAYSSLRQTTDYLIIVVVERFEYI